MSNKVDNYIKQFPQSTQIQLFQLRSIIKRLAPTAEEDIKYGMPTFVLNGNLVHFAAFKNHIGFYPTPSAINNFKDELKDFKWSKGAIQFPLGKPLPVRLITRMLKFRISESIK